MVDLEKLNVLNEKVKALHNKFLGYPQNQSFNYDYLYSLDLFHSCINNLGDPYIDSNYRINSKEIEQEVIKYFAKLYNDEDMWGYVTADGTEGNLFGIYIGREMYPDGLLYFSEDSHYSIPKAARMYRMETRVIKSLENGEIDCNDFESNLDHNRPVIINLNIGTTVKGAIDNLDWISSILERHSITQYYIHCDMALFGMILPFLENAPKVDFSKNIGSISISGHKFIGCPIPCGVVLTKREYVQKVEEHIEYLGTLDTTILGSRCGLTPIYLWYAIAMRGESGFHDEANMCIENAKYLYDALQQIGYPCWRNEFSNTVYFQKPSESLIIEWQLAKQKDIAHIVVVQHVTKEKIDTFLEDLKKDRNIE